MKKLLIILITIPLIFGSCEKEEDNNNNNSDLSIEQTKWNVNSLTIKDNIYGNNVTYNIPVTDEEGWDTGIEEIEWTFFNNNGFFVEKWTSGDNPKLFSNGYTGNTSYDTLIYTYYENLNTISFTDPNGGYVSMLDDDVFPTGGIQITQFNSNNLTVEINEVDTFYNVTWTVDLSRIQ